MGNGGFGCGRRGRRCGGHDVKYSIISMSMGVWLDLVSTERYTYTR